MGLLYCVKTAYADQATAIKARDHLAFTGEPYWCPACQAWHIKKRAKKKGRTKQKCT